MLIAMESSGITVCRLCLSNGNTNSMVPLVNKSENIVTCYGSLLVHLSPIKITILDDLPQFMCKKCLLQLKQIIAFKLKCENSDKTLNMLKNTLQSQFSNKIRLQKEIIQHAMLIRSEMFPAKHRFSNLNLVPENNNQQTTMNYKNNGSIFQYSKNESKKLHLSKNEEVHITKETCNYDLKGPSPSEGRLFHDEPIEQNLQDEIKLLSKIEELVKSQLTCYEKNEISNTLIKWKRPDLADLTRQLDEKKTLILIEKMFEKYPKRFSSQRPRNLTCKVCNKTFLTPNMYECHRKTHYKLKFMCEHCGKGFKFQAELNLHTVSVHKTGSFIQCKKCPFKAAKKFLLVEHERIHTGERPFSCDKCGLTFRRQAILRNHERYHKEKTVQCLHCAKKFYTKWHMMSHVNNSHERSYLYLCPVCGVKYAKNSTVRRHLLEKHGILKHLQGKISRVLL